MSPFSKKRRIKPLLLVRIGFSLDRGNPSTAARRCLTSPRPIAWKRGTPMPWRAPLRPWGRGNGANDHEVEGGIPHVCVGGRENG